MPHARHSKVFNLHSCLFYAQHPHCVSSRYTCSQLCTHGSADFERCSEMHYWQVAILKQEKTTLSLTKKIRSKVSSAVFFPLFKWCIIRMVRRNIDGFTMCIYSARYTLTHGLRSSERVYSVILMFPCTTAVGLQQISWDT